MKIPWTVWVGAAVVILGLLTLRGFTQAQYWKGIADSAAAQAIEQTTIIDDARSRIDSLRAGFAELTEVALQHAEEDSIRLVELERTTTRASALSDSLEVELAARLDSVQVEQLEQLVRSHRLELGAVKEALAIEKEGRRVEALRADRATNIVVALEAQVERLEGRDAVRTAEIEALREATGGLSLSVRTGWLAGVGGVVLGYGIASAIR
jgi:hypothetical protein